MMIIMPTSSNGLSGPMRPNAIAPDEGKAGVQYLLAICATPPSFQLMATVVTPRTLPQPPRDFHELFQRVEPQMAALDLFMRREVEHFEPEIRGMAAYCLDTTGKRLRPTLVFVSGWEGKGGGAGCL